MPLDATPRRSALGDHEQSRDAVRIPAAFARDERTNSCLPIETEDHGLDVRDDGLHLDDGDRSGRSVPGKNVNRAALTVDRKRSLDGRLPTSGSQKGHDSVDDDGMRLVEEPIERLAAPTKVELKVRSQRCRESVERPERNSADPAVLNRAHERVGKPDPPGDIGLPKVLAAAEGADAAAEPDRIHAAIMSGHTSLGMHR
jgi:hypothetical protein